MPVWHYTVAAQLAQCVLSRDNKGDYMKMKSLIAVAVAATTINVAGAQAQAQTIEVVLFAGASAMPTYVAQDKGFFAKHRLTVNVTPTPSSGFQMSNLIAGKFQIAGTAIDNLLAYQEGQGTAKVDRTPDLIAFLGGPGTELALLAQPSIKSIAELKGKEFALDSLSTGYAFVLRKMLEKNGLKPSDYKFVAVGGTLQRLQALRSGKMAAALITPPFTTQARAEGFTFLGDGIETVGRYQASVHIANRAWAKANEQALIGYIRGVVEGIDWIYNPANREEAARILAGRIKIAEAAARPAIAALVEGSQALPRKGEMDLEGVKTVIALREQYGEPQKKMAPPEKYYDPSYYRKAIASMN